MSKSLENSYEEEEDLEENTNKGQNGEPESSPQHKNYPDTQRVLNSSMNHLDDSDDVYNEVSLIEN